MRGTTRMELNLDTSRPPWHAAIGEVPPFGVPGWIVASFGKEREVAVWQPLMDCDTKIVSLRPETAGTTEIALSPDEAMALVNLLCRVYGVHGHISLSRDGDDLMVWSSWAGAPTAP